MRGDVGRARPAVHYRGDHAAVGRTRAIAVLPGSPRGRVDLGRLGNSICRSKDESPVATGPGQCDPGTSQRRLDRWPARHSEHVCRRRRERDPRRHKQTAASESAVRWATREAAASGCGLYIVHVIDAHMFGVVALDELRAAPDVPSVVDNAVAIARPTSPCTFAAPFSSFSAGRWCGCRGMQRSLWWAGPNAVISRRIAGSMAWHLLAAGRATVVVDAGTARSASAATNGLSSPSTAAAARGDDIRLHRGHTRNLPVHLVHAARSPDDVDPDVVAASWRQRYPDVAVTTAAAHRSVAETMKINVGPAICSCSAAPSGLPVRMSARQRAPYWRPCHARSR